MPSRLQLRRNASTSRDTASLLRSMPLLSLLRSMPLLSLLLLTWVERSSAWTQRLPFRKTVGRPWRSEATVALRSSSEDGEPVDLSSLIDMDIVVYRDAKDDGPLRFGAMQENGRLEPLSVWTTEPAFGDSLEFLVDEKDRFTLPQDRIVVLHRLPESSVSYGSRQCARGVHNPHGEESELLYYIDQSVIDQFDVDVVVKPELEMLW